MPGEEGPSHATANRKAVTPDRAPSRPLKPQSRPAPDERDQDSTSHLYAYRPPSDIRHGRLRAHPTTHSSDAHRVERCGHGKVLDMPRGQSAAVNSADRGRRLTGESVTESSLSLRMPAQRAVRRGSGILAGYQLRHADQVHLVCCDLTPELSLGYDPACASSGSAVGAWCGSGQPGPGHFCRGRGCAAPAGRSGCCVPCG